MTWEDFITDVSYAGFSGFTIGFAIKKLMNVLLMFIGFYIFSLLWLQSKGIISVNWEQFSVFFKSLFENVDIFVKTVASSSAFAAGFFLGFKAG
jgi:uncharacterized membrane protein (Fun14 family)